MKTMKTMKTKKHGAMRWVVLFGAATAWACTDAPTDPSARGPSANRETARHSDVLETTRWNDRATLLLQGAATASPDSLPLGVPVPPNSQAWASRMLTYLSLAQYRAAAAASDRKHGSKSHETEIVSSAVASASLVVLEAFFGTDPGMRPELTPAVRQQILDFLAQEYAAESRGREFTAVGARIGREVGAAVVTQAKADNYGLAPLPARNLAPGYWFPMPTPTTPTVRSLYGVTPFFLRHYPSAPPPPAVGSQALRDAAAAVYAVTAGRTPEQLAIANKWNRGVPVAALTAGEWNRTAVRHINAHRRTELEASRILAQANVASFDAQIDCFTSKFAYWLPRPSQVDDRLRAPFLAFPPPNHPSYPSGHSCISSAFGTVLQKAFPHEESIGRDVTEAGMSRIYAGIHYDFDVSAGQDIGKRAAAKMFQRWHE